MLVGFHFPHEKEGTTPYEFVTDPVTGMRPKVFGSSKPSGYAKTNLQEGIWQANLPPLAIWEDGFWVSEITGVEEEQKFSSLLKTLPMNEQFDSWLVSGEGTPGNFLYRVYLVPQAISATVDPKHPLLWPDALKKPPPKSIYTQPPRTALPGGTGGWAYQGGGQPQAAAKPKPKAAPALPTGLRIRCQDCGHFWKESGLAPHINNCCPGKQGFHVEGIDQMISDWVIQCECCDTLDQAAQCKPGYPRPKKEVTPKEPESKEPVAAVATPA